MKDEGQRAGPLPVRSFNHASRVCRDVEASVRFYRHILGFIRIQRPSSFDFDGAWCVARHIFRAPLPTC